MDAEYTNSQPHDYMHKEHSIKVDVVNSQANVPHIFKKTKVPPITEPFVNIYNGFDNDLESQSDVQYLIDNKLYEKYRFIFNNIPKNAIYNYNNKEKESNYLESEDTTYSSRSYDSRCNEFKKQKIDLDSYINCKIDDESCYNVASIFQQWISVLLSMSKVGDGSTNFQDIQGPIIKDRYHLDSDLYEEISDSSATDFNFSTTEFNSSGDSVFENVETKSNTTLNPYNGFKETLNKIDYKFIKKMSTILVGFISHMDDWKIRVEDSLSRIWTDRLTLDQARKLLDEFKELSSGLIICDSSEKLENEIKNTEKYTLRARETLSNVFIDSKQKLSLTKEKTSLDLSLVESFLKDGMETTFVTQEYLTLSQLFHSVSSLRHMLDQSVLESDLVECDSLIKEFDNTIIKLPHLEKLKSFISKSFWFDRAKRYSQTPVHYKLICELVENTPPDLVDHKLYHILRDKLSRTYEWIEVVNGSGLCSIVKNINSKGGDNNRNKDKDKCDNKECNKNEDYQMSSKRTRTGELYYKNTGQLENKENDKKNKDQKDNKDSKEKVKHENKDKEKQNKEQQKLKPKDIEYMYNNYQQLEVLVPIFKSVEHVYIIWKRFQRKYRKFLNLKRTKSCTNFTMEAMVLLQQSEQVTEYLDLSLILDPIIKDVEISLNFERKFRQIMVKFNNWSITNLCVKFNTDWNTLANFRKTASVSENDLVEVINIMYIYQNYIRETIGKKNNNEQITIDDSSNNNTNNNIKNNKNSNTNKSTTYNTNNNVIDQNIESCSLSSSTSSCESLTSISSSSNSSATNRNLNSSNSNTNTGGNNNTKNNRNNTNTNTSSSTSTANYNSCNSNSSISGKGTTKKTDIDARVEFSEIMQLNGEFNALKIKNWPIYRVLEEMCNTALHIKERAENIIKDINEGYRSDGLMSNLILVTLDTLKFGANLNLDEKLLKVLKFCLWVKNLYSLFLKLYIIMKSRSRNNEVMGFDRNEGININDLVYGRGKNGFEELKENYSGEFEDVYKEFLLYLRELSNQAIAENFKDFLDSKISIGFRLNIFVPNNTNQLGNDNKCNLRIDGLKNIIDVNRMFTLTEKELVASFTPS